MTLSGCSSGFTTAVIPDVPVSSQQTSIGPLQGSVYGGHAPLVGAHVYVLQASTSGYGAQATSLLNSPAATNGATATNTGDYGFPTTWNYIPSNSNGSFSITGDYASCTAGLPVWLAAYGGAPTFPSGSNTFTITSVTTSGTTSPYTVTFTTSATELASIGESVSFAGLSSDGASPSPNLEALNGGSFTVATPLTNNTFSIQVTTLSAVGTYTQAAATATFSPANNPGIVNLAMLGICPSSGSFATGGTVTLASGGVQSAFTPLPFVYMNEVSTAAMAYAMAGFGSDGTHIGTDTSASATLTAPGLAGIQNAALNAANLYSIAGTYVSTSLAGEGHIANPTTISGNGTVPQAELDTIGNILAACVDSSNTYNPTTGTGTLSPQCSILFSFASSTGGLPANYTPNNGAPTTTGGTQASNTAQAAFNMAHFPQSPYVVQLYSLPSGNVPFTPHLTSAPNDFTVGILYSGISNPTNVAIDSYGDAYFSASSGSGYVAKYNPQGTLLAVSSSVETGLDAIALDQKGNLWGTSLGTDFNNGQVGNGVLYEFNSTLTPTAQYSTLFAPLALTIDSSNNLYIPQYNSFPGGTYAMAEFVSPVYNAPVEIDNKCAAQASGIAIDTTGYLWLADNTGSNEYCRVTKLGTSVFTNGGGSFYGVALTSSNTGWFANYNQAYLYNTTASGSATTYGRGSGNNQNDYLGGLYHPTWLAVDGGGNVFVINDNGTNTNVSEFSSTGTPLSCPSCLNTGQSSSYYGYQAGNLTSITGTKLNGDIYTGGIAIDPSGDVWIPNYTGNSFLEIIGVATPVVTPLSSQMYGTRP